MTEFLFSLILILIRELNVILRALFEQLTLRSNIPVVLRSWSITFHVDRILELTKSKFFWNFTRDCNCVNCVNLKTLT